jgi:hypothetical protein
LTLTHRRFSILFAGAALALAGCGGSSHSSSKSTQSVAQVANTTPSAVTTTTTSTTTSDPKQKANKARHHSASHSGATPVTHHRAHRAPTTHSSHTSPVSVRRSKPGKVIGPSPLVCLRQRGLIRARTLGPDRWWATDFATLKPVYVDGPFKTVAQAKADVSSLQGVESAVRGGLYVVNAALSSHINNDVTLVAACLSTTTGRGSLSF